MVPTKVSRVCLSGDEVGALGGRDFLKEERTNTMMIDFEVVEEKDHS